MKRILKKIKEWFGWFNPAVLDAINAGNSYEEVEAIAKGERK